MRFNIIIFAPDRHGLKPARVAGHARKAGRVSQVALVSPVTRKNVPGGLTGGATPVPIPNTEVKPSKADDTAAVRQWESRTLPGYKKSLMIERSSGSSLLSPSTADYFP